MLLAGRGILGEIRDLIEHASRLDLAVAYWGEGACRALRLEKCKAKNIRIVCDFRSGATNPDEIAMIQRRLKNKHVVVKQMDRLHAKVYLSERRCVVGSANASTDGLGWEGPRTSNLIEACYSFDQRQKQEMREARTWFERTWRRASKITPTDVSAARRRFNERQKRRPLNRRNPTSMLSLSEWMKDINDVKRRNILVFLMTRQLDKAERAALKQYQQATGQRYITAYGDELSRNWSLTTILRDYPEDHYILEFWKGRKNRIYYDGAFYIPKTGSNFYRSKKHNRNGVLVFVQEAKRIDFIDGTRLRIDRKATQLFENTIRAMKPGQISRMVEEGADLYHFLKTMPSRASQTPSVAPKPPNKGYI